MTYNIHVGQSFASIEEAKNYVKAHCHQEKQWFRIRSSGVRKRTSFKRKKEAGTYTLLYYYKHGKDVRTRGTGSRKTKTCRLGCNAFIKIIVNMSTRRALVKDCNLDHNTHPMTTAFYHMSREVRLDLSEESKNTIDSKLQVDGDKRKIQVELIEKGNHVSLRDLSKRKALLKTPDGNNLQKVVDFLQNEKQADVYLSYDDNKDVTGIFFCTEEMKSNFAKFPEMLGIDGTYKLTSIELTFVLLLVVDGEGSSEIVGASLLAGEDADNFEWLLNSFAECNPKASEVKCVMSDKCAKERAALAKVFPETPLLICRFHTMQIFERNLQTKINKQEERNKCKEILTKMIYSSSEEEYMRHYEKLCTTAPESVVTYFNDNWHDIRLLWCDYGMTNFNLGNLTNNRLESINQKLKQIIKKRNSLLDFFIKFFKWEKSHFVQNDFKTMSTYCSRLIESLSNTSTDPVELYRTLLTTEAFESIQENFERCEFLTFREINKNEKYCLLKSKTLNIRTDLTTCECPFWKRMHLPCHHIFGVRLHFKNPLYDENLCHQRWKRSHSISYHRLFRETTTANLHSQIRTLCITRKKSKSKTIITEPENRRKIKKITDKITEHISHLCGEKFNEKESQLKKVWHCLKNNIKFQIVESNASIDDHKKDGDELVTALAGLSFDEGNGESELVNDLKMPSPIQYRGRPSQMSVTTPTVRKSKKKPPVRISP